MPPRPAARRSRLRCLSRAAEACAALTLLLALACASTPSLPEPRETGQLVFWEISDASGPRGHLLGTVHVGRKAGPPAFDPAIERGLAAADALVMEVPPDELEPTGFAQVLLQKGLLTDGRTLPDLLSEETWQRLREHLDDQGVPQQSVLYMEPWVAYFIVVASVFEEQGLEAAQGVEHRLLRAADERPVLGLETVESQLDLFASLEIEDQVRLLEAYLAGRDRESDAAHLDRMLAAWRMGDLDTLAAYGAAGRTLHPDLSGFYDDFIERRNHRMAERLGTLLREDDRDLFVMVGALHTVGAQGVPALLAEQGFEVRRVPKSSAGAARGAEAAR